MLHFAYGSGHFLVCILVCACCSILEQELVLSSELVDYSIGSTLA
jgi:hypothetical protein